MVDEEGEGLGWIRPLGELLTGGIHFRKELVSLIKLTQGRGNLEKVFNMILNDEAALKKCNVWQSIVHVQETILRPPTLHCDFQANPL